MRRMVKVIVKQVTDKEIVDLDEMLIRVSESEGQPKPEQLQVLQAFRSLTGVQA